MQYKQVNGTTKGLNVSIVDVDTILESQSNNSNTVTGLYRETGIIWRCTQLRMQSVANIPFVLHRGTEQVADSANWEDPTGGMPNPHDLIAIIEGGLTVFGEVYLSKDITNDIAPGLRYLLPTSVHFKEVLKGQLHFERTVNGKRYNLTTKDLVYLWGLDPTIEIGPPKVSPVRAAMKSANTVNAFDEFAERFTNHGMIKTTLLGVPEGTSPEERQRVESIFTKLYTGVMNAFRIKVINADAIKPVIIGEGLESLQGGAMLSMEEKRIAREMGVPYSILEANAANYATAQQDARNFYNLTTIPEANAIAEALNTQWYEERGYRFNFNPNALEEFQRDETERASAYATYINAGMLPSVTAEMLGLNLPAGVGYADLDPTAEEATPAPEPEAPGVDMPPETTPEAITVDNEDTFKALSTWARFAKTRYNENHPQKALTFESDHIPTKLHGQITHGLEHCQNVGNVAKVFELAKAIVIGGDGEDDNANAPERDKPERRLTKQVQTTLDAFYPESVEYVTGETAEQPDYNALRVALYALLVAHYIQVATDRLEQMEGELQLPVDEGQSITQWAQQQATTRAAQLTQTTQDSVESARNAYTVDTTDAELEQLLRYGFASYRASTIAISETTTALTEAATIYAALLALLALSAVRVWNTMEDERVCPICGPLHLQPYSVWREQFPDGPPAHPRCRCYESLMIA